MHLESAECSDLGLDRLALVQAETEDHGVGLATAAALLNAERGDDALPLYLNIWRSSHDPGTLEPLSRMLSARDGWKELHQILTEAMQLGLKGPETRLLGNYHADTGDAELATRMFTMAAEQGDDKAWHELGRHLQEIGEPRRAEECFLKALDLGVDKANWSYALFLLQQELPDRAREAAAQAIRDGWIGALVPYAQAEAELGNMASAEAAFLDAIDEDCADAEVAYLQHLARQNRRAEARALLVLWREDLEDDEVAFVDEFLNAPHS